MSKDNFSKMKTVEKITRKIFKVWFMLLVTQILFWIFGLMYCSSDYKCKDNTFAQFMSILWTNLAKTILIIGLVIAILLIFIILGRLINFTRNGLIKFLKRDK